MIQDAILRLTPIFFVLAMAGLHTVSAEDPIGDLLIRPEPPPGVVFEIVSGNEAALVERMPLAAQYASRLRARFPGLEVAVVTHGAEQFSLLTTRRDQYPELHSLVESFDSKRNIAVHVCANHASWRDKTAEDFPDYVDPAVSASAQLRDYRALGFVIIQL